MLRLIIIAIAAILCGMAAGRRGVPVPLGVAAAIVFGIFGGSVARLFGPAVGLLGTLVSCGVCVLLFALLPVSRESGRASSTPTEPQLEATEVTCPHCGRAVASTSRICPRCMNRLHEPPRPPKT